MLAGVKRFALGTAAPTIVVLRRAHPCARSLRHALRVARGCSASLRPGHRHAPARVLRTPTQPRARCAPTFAREAPRRVGLTAARFKPNPLRCCCWCSNSGQQEEGCGADRHHRHEQMRELRCDRDQERHRRGSAPTPRPRLLILLPADPWLGRSRHPIPAEAEPANRDAVICSPNTAPSS